MSLLRSWRKRRKLLSINSYLDKYSVPDGTGCAARKLRSCFKGTWPDHSFSPRLLVTPSPCLFLSHSQQHISETIDHTEQSSSRLIELIRGGLLFGGSRVAGNTRERDVVKLQRRCRAEISLQLV